MFTKPYAIRDWDDLGCGHYQASRGSRLHNGIDFCAEPDEKLVTPVSGVVTKLGYCYGDDLSYRYVEVTGTSDRRHRFFYISPGVQVGEIVTAGETALGCVQDIAARYKHRGFMNNHFHYEVLLESGGYVNPELALVES